MSGAQLRHAGINLGGTEIDPDADAESGVFGFWVFLDRKSVV